MSFTERLILWLHIGVAIFTIGPATAAIMSTPRYIKKRETVIVAFLHRITRIYAIGSVLVLVFGLVIASMNGDMARPWISISMTLFVVAAVLLVLIDRAQGHAADALRRIAAAVAPVPNLPAVADDQDAGKKDRHHFGRKDHGSKSGAEKAGAELEGEDGDDKATAATVPATATATVPAPDATHAPAAAAAAPAPDTTEDERLVAVERGRIVSLGGITSLIWLVILILMVWK